MNIEVKYDGGYPATCMGNLIIIVDGEEIYNKSFCCYSTGSVWFDDEWNANIDEGELLWEDADKFPQEIQDAVSEKLSNYNVCCGGCI